MRKKLCFLFIIILCLGTFTACNSNDKNDKNSEPENNIVVEENVVQEITPEDDFLSDNDNTEALDESTETASDEELDLTAISNAAIGETICFGRYEQDNDLDNGQEPIEWYVLKKEDGKMTLLSVYILDYQSYNEELEAITWENCSLREWLNNDFYNTAFSENEQSKIIDTFIDNENLPSNFEGRYIGNNTTDKVFCLSIGEAGYILRGELVTGIYSLSESQLLAMVTPYVKEIPSYASTNDYTFWWLRSPGSKSDEGQSAAIVDSEGHSFGAGAHVALSHGVRPAITIVFE